MKNLIIVLTLSLSTFSFAQNKSCADAILAWNSISKNLDSKVISETEAEHMFNSLRKNYGSCVPNKQVEVEPQVLKREVDEFSIFLEKLEKYLEIRSPYYVFQTSGSNRVGAMFEEIQLRKQLRELYYNIEAKTPGKLQNYKKILRVRE